MTLPFDVARCTGTDSPTCDNCRRKEKGDEEQWQMSPPIDDDVCEFKIVSAKNET